MKMKAKSLESFTSKLTNSRSYWGMCLNRDEQKETYFSLSDHVVLVLSSIA